MYWWSQMHFFKCEYILADWKLIFRISSFTIHTTTKNIITVSETNIDPEWIMMIPWFKYKRIFTNVESRTKRYVAFFNCTIYVSLKKSTWNLTMFFYSNKNSAVRLIRIWYKAVTNVLIMLYCGFASEKVQCAKS